MAMRLMLGDRDERYLSQMKLFMARTYSEELFIQTYSSPEELLSALRAQGADVVLVSTGFGISADELYDAGASAAAYLGNRDGTDESGTERVIGKYKRADLFYEAVRSTAEAGEARARMRLAAERERNEALRLAAERNSAAEESDDEPTVLMDTPFADAEGAYPDAARLIAVMSFSGGTGVTTVAAALARNLKARNQETLYLNLETLNSSGPLFPGTIGGGPLGDALSALQKRPEDPAEAVLAPLARDASGVALYQPGERPELLPVMNEEETAGILAALRYAGAFSHIVADLEFAFTESALTVLNSADQILVLSDGTMTANEKYLRGMELLRLIEQEKGMQISSRMSLLYNRFSSSESSREIPDAGIGTAGKIPPLMHAAGDTVVAYMADNMKVLRRLG